MSDIASTVVGGSEGGAESAPDTTSSFSFADVHEKAMAYGADTPATPEQVAAPAEPAAPAETPAPSPEAATPAQLAQIADDQLVEVIVDGQPVQMPWRDAKNGIQRQSHYTKSMQQLRADQQTFQAERQALAAASAEREQLATLIQSPELLQRFIAQQYPQLLQQAQAIQQAQQVTDPDDIATVGQLAQMQQAAAQNIAAMQQQMEANLQARLQQVTQTIEDRAETAKLSESINGTIGEIFTAHSYLKELIPNAEQLLRYEVLQLQPSTPAETIQAFKQVAEGWVENFNRQVEAKNKTSVIAKNTLVKNNIMPPGGASVQPTPSTFKKVNPMTGKTEVDWTAMRSTALGYLDSK